MKKSRSRIFCTQKLLLWLFVGAVTLFLAPRAPTGLVPFWPAIAALIVIIATRHAATGLATGFAVGCLLLADGDPLAALRSAFSDHLFPSLEGRWHLAAIVFTLVLGSFAALLERGGGFVELLARLTRGSSQNPDRRVLLAVYGTGLLCFFDGLANSLLLGRVGRQSVDRAGVSRERLAWVVDSTSSPVACVAFLSTWIATQLGLILDSLPTADPYALYFRSIPANFYCLLTLLLVPLAISLRWEPRAMRRFSPQVREENYAAAPSCAPWRALVPLGVLAVSIALSLQLWSGNEVQLLSLAAWRESASGEGGPIALVAGSLAGLLAAWLCYPAERKRERATAVSHGAAGLLPAVIILILAWCLGGVFRDLGAADQIKELLGTRVSGDWLPLAVFATGALAAFATGSAWGTMALVMPLALGVVAASSAPVLAAPAVIGAVFGGSVFGDHCSPFSDTTIVSAMAAGCEPIDHVTSQLPFALISAGGALLGYTALAFDLPATVALLLVAALMLAGVFWSAKRDKRRRTSAHAA